MKKTAIILFAHLPEFEARAKSFCGFSSKKATQKLSSILTNHFYKLAKQTNAETFLIDTYHQKGKSFGERIANAFADIFDKGFEHVICIGNDCPALSLSQLENAITQTEKGNVVLGPTVDGGAYLIGIPKAEFHKKDFQNIKWQSKKTYHYLYQSFTDKRSEIYEKELLSDVDGDKDILNLNKKLVLVQILLNVIQQFVCPKNQKNKYIASQDYHQQSLLFRGPPLWFF